jgi:two-component system, chemotaxis family, chemotaxis protein CheY
LNEGANVPQNYNILIVDDSATTRAMIKRIIQMTGLPVAGILEATDGDAALRLLATTTKDDVHIVLTDINMPNMNGLEMTRRMRQSPQLNAIPVVVITARPDDEMTEEFKNGLVQGWLTKPFTPEKVREVVLQALGITIGVGGQNA